MPRRGRGPRSTARSSAAMARRFGIAEQRMLEHGKQRHRLGAAKADVGDQARKHPGRRVGERVAGGIVDGDIPALERGDDAPRQRAVRA